MLAYANTGQGMGCSAETPTHPLGIPPGYTAITVSLITDRLASLSLDPRIPVCYIHYN